MLSHLAPKPKEQRLPAPASQPQPTTPGFHDRLTTLVAVLLALARVSPTEAGERSATEQTGDDLAQSAAQPAEDTPGGNDAVPPPASGPAGEHTAPFSSDQLPPLASQVSTATGVTERPTSTEPDTGDTQRQLASQDAQVAPPAAVHHGSSTSPTLLSLNPVQRDDVSLPSKVIAATPGSDVLIGDAASTTFVFVGSPGPQNFDVFIGSGRQNTVDFSGITGLAPNTPISPSEQGDQTSGADRDNAALNGIFVDLSANEQTAESAVGPVTVQAWLLDADGKADTPLAHLENIDSVVGTIGNDVMVGNATANTFVYTAFDDARADASGHTVSGPAASYGFDIFFGGEVNGSLPIDDNDTVDFSHLASSDEVAAAAAREVDLTLLPHDAEGITVDLAKSVAVTTVDPETGELTTVSGSVVSAIDGTQQTDLALLVWTQPDEDSTVAAQSTIENVVSTGGRDAIWGNDGGNTFVVSGCGGNGPSYYDGRGGDDTMDFSRLSSADPTQGVEIHLNQKVESVSDPLGGVQQDVVLALDTYGNHDPIAVVKNIEHIIGSSGDDVLEGDEHDNVLWGGDGSDTFYFKDFDVVDGQIVARIGNDTIGDFNSGHESSNSGHGNSEDRLYLDARLFGLDDHKDLDWFEHQLNKYLRDSDQGLVIRIDADNSIILQNFHGDTLNTYPSWIVLT